MSSPSVCDVLVERVRLLGDQCDGQICYVCVMYDVVNSYTCCTESRGQQ